MGTGRDRRRAAHPAVERHYRLATMAYAFGQGDGYPALAEYDRPYRSIRDFESFVKFVRSQKVRVPGRFSNTNKSSGSRIIFPPVHKSAFDSQKFCQ
jgi:hypothetical protein